MNWKKNNTENKRCRTQSRYNIHVMGEEKEWGRSNIQTTSKKFTKLRKDINPQNQEP